MKRLFSIGVCLLAVCVCLSCAMADESWELPDIVWKIIPFGEDALAVLNGGEVYFLGVGMEPEHLTVTLDGEERRGMVDLFAGQDGLYALFYRTGEWLLCEAVPGEQSLSLTALDVVPLPWEELGLLTAAACEEGIAVLKDGDLFCWNPETGNTIEWRDWGNRPLVAGGGMLLTLRETTETSTMAVQRVNLASHSVSNVTTAPWMQDIAMSPDGRTVAWRHNTVIDAWQEGEEESKGYLGTVSIAEAHASAVTNGQRFYLAEERRVLSVQTMPGFVLENAGLVIGHSGINLMVNRIRSNHGDLDIIDHQITSGLNPADVAQAIRSGDQSVDIYLLRTGTRGYRALLEKGFCMDLSGDEELVGQISAMPASFAEAVMADGRLLAVPYGVLFSWGTMGCSAQALEAMNLTMEDMSTSIDSLLDALSVWLAEGRMDEVWLCDTHEDASWLYSMARNYYVLCAGGEQAYIDLGTPAFRALLTKCDQVARLLQARGEPDVNAPALLTHRDLSKFLGTSSFGEVQMPWQTVDPSDWQMLRISALPGQEPVIDVVLEVAVVNPLSPKREEAIAFLQLMLKETPEKEALHLWPGRAKAMANITALKDIKILSKEIGEYEELLARDDLTTDQRESAERDLASLQTIMADYERRRWLVTEEAVEAYRAVQDALIVQTGDMMDLIFDAGGRTIENRYFDDQATIEQVIETYVNLSRSIMLENQ